MKYLICILLFLNIPIEAQTLSKTYTTATDTEYYYTYGGKNFEEIRGIKETADHGYILAGTTSSFGQGATSVYLIKTDSLGNHKWSSVQGGTQNDWAYSVELTYDHGFFVAGYSNSFYDNNSFDYSAYFFKTDANGNLLWQKYLDNGAWSYIYGSCIMPDSGFLLCGKTYATTNGDADAYLIRITKDGNVIWNKHYGGNKDEVFNSVCVMNKSIYAVGSNGTHPGADSLADGWIVKLNINGDTLATTIDTLGTKQIEVLNGITPYNSSLFTVCGSNTSNQYNSTAPILMQYDTSLNVTTSNTWSPITTSGYVANLMKTINLPSGDIGAIGYATGGVGAIDMFFGEFTQTGWLIYAPHHSGGILNDYGYNGILTSAHKIIGIGSTQGFGGMSTFYCTDPNMGLEDAFLVRFNSDSMNNATILSNQPSSHCFADSLFLWEASVKKYASEPNDFVLYPNPVSEMASLKCNVSVKEKIHWEVLSILGTIILQDDLSINAPLCFNFSTLMEGSYFLKITDSNGQNITVLKFSVSR